MARNRKYFLDPTDLQFKQVKVAWRYKVLRFFFWLAGSVLVSILYFKIVEANFGSPKEKHLTQEIDALKLKYSILDRKFVDSYNSLNYLRQSDEIRFRPVLNMDSVPLSYRNPGFGGVDRYREFTGFEYGPLMADSRQTLDILKNMSNVQAESFRAISERKDEWIRENEHLPRICPVDVIYPRGDGLKFRLEHPVLGTARWHNGQDFRTPFGTDVHATGAGKVITTGYLSSGFGNYVVIDHGYGFSTIYGHLSKIEVTEGMNVKRGDLIGLSGDSGTSTGPHLHYQIDFNGNHKNPLEFFADDLTPEEYREMILTLSSKSRFR